MEQHVGDGYCIGDLSLDLEARTLRRGDVLIELPPLSFGLLALLAERAPAVVSHDEIAELVWPGRVVSPETLTQRVKLLRSALSDDARSPRYVGLVRGEGYRLLCDAHRVSSGAKISGPKPSSRLRPRLFLFAALRGPGPRRRLSSPMRCTPGIFWRKNQRPQTIVATTTKIALIRRARGDLGGGGHTCLSA